MPLEELTLTAYQCPINIIRENPNDAVKLTSGGLYVGHYIVFGNLKSVIDEMKRHEIEPYGSDADFILRRDLDQNDLYKCKRLGKTRFYDLKTRETFHSTLHHPIRINLFTHDIANVQTPNKLKQEMIKQLDEDKTRSSQAKDRIEFLATMLAGGIGGAVFGEKIVKICILPDITTYCYNIAPFILFPIGMVALPLAYLGVRHALKLGEKNEILFSNIKGGIIDTSNLEVSEHPELRDIFRALETASDLEIETPQNPEFYRVCREVQRRLSERARSEAGVDRYALKLYSEKVKNWNDGLREKGK